MKEPTYTVITPVRDEAGFIRKTIHSMVRQTLLPAKWIIVDDGSTDETLDILTAEAKEYSWIQIVHRHNRGFRKSGGGVIEAFYEGYPLIQNNPWNYLVKLDGDLSFERDYFARCIAEFEGDQRLGIGGGTVYVKVDGRLKIDSMGDPPFHVRGATKIYRRTCWEQISPLMQAPGWDTIDEVKANMHGWITRTFHDIPVIQLKATGAVDGDWDNWLKNGLANYVTGYHPLFMLGKCFKRAFQRPFLKISTALWIGFCSGYFNHMPRVHDYEAIRYLRRQQLRRLLSLPSIYG